MKRRARQKHAAGREAVQRTIAHLEQDLREARRIAEAVRRNASDAASEELYVKIGRYATSLSRSLRWQIDQAQNLLAVEGDGSTISADQLARMARARRRLHKVASYLPARLFAGVALETSSDERAEVTAMERKPVPDSPHLEDALLQLPTDWLKAIAERTCVRGHRARRRLAAAIATTHYFEDKTGLWLRSVLSLSQRRLLASLVAVGRCPLAELTPAQRVGFIVPRSWGQMAPGNGAVLRQLGFAFVGRHEDRPTLYIPDGMRPALAWGLLDARTLPVKDRNESLHALAAVDAARRTRERRHRGDGELGYVPSRLSRIRHRTPGPDRVVEIETTMTDIVKPVDRLVTRRILISYQRSVGALREVIQRALGWWHRHDGMFTFPEEGQPFRCWGTPGDDNYAKGSHDEWATSIRDALSQYRGRLRFAEGGVGNNQQHCIRVVRVHAPERVKVEPNVIWGEGVLGALDSGTSNQDLDQIRSASVMLERFQS